MSNKKDKAITNIKSKYGILKQSKSNNIDCYKYVIPEWKDIDRIEPLKIWK